MIGLLPIIKKIKNIVNLGLIGAGEWGSNYIRLIQGISEINLCAISRRNHDYEYYRETLPSGVKYYNSWNSQSHHY